MTESPTPPEPEFRLHAEEFAARWLRSPVGGLIARPWFDAVALRLLARWFFPLSRLWAAARAAEGSVARFYEEIPLAPVPHLEPRLREALAKFESAREAVNATEARWREVFFGPEAVAPHHLVAVETARRDRRHAYNATRRNFLFLARGRKIPLVKWDIPSPEEVEADYANALASPESAFPAPATMPEITQSHRVPGLAGSESWIRFPSPSPRMDDEVIARVYEPEGVTDPPTVIFGHGVCVEFDHWHGLVDEVFTMCRMGIRVVRPEAPWHGRRVPPGRYGGEAFIARAPRGALDIFTAQLPEWAALIDWARRTSKGPVAVGGSSLGALAAQLLATRARYWPARLHPDALFLVTHCGRHEDAAVRGALARVWGIPEAAAASGWTQERLHKWLPLLDPIGKPVVDPGNIVSVLGGKDKVTPFDSGEKLIRGWGIPDENAFIWRCGHFSVPMKLIRDDAPIRRFREILSALPNR